MRKIMVRILAILLAALMLLGVLLPALRVNAAQMPAVEIHTPEELAAIANSPDGSYRLMADLDMSGVDWIPMDFSGVFDGNGHSILNLRFSESSGTTAVTYDGNRKTYATEFCGLFGQLCDAEVSDLHLINVRSVVETDAPCFVGAIAGFCKDSVIYNCTVSGQIELRAHDRMFGVGGIVGYGSGRVDSCQADMTLICVDTDAESKDEQFLGGAYAAGYIDVINSQVALDGYISDHGYVHSGGAVGMYIQYPLDTDIIGYLNGNTISGKITFFEDNYDRRAYCEGLVGETMNWRYQERENEIDFLRDERFEYDRELRPEMCTSPEYTTKVTAANCRSFGFTEYSCSHCGYTYRDDYTLCSHTVSVWRPISEATTTEFGSSEGTCDLCGESIERQDAMLQIEPTQPQVPTMQNDPQPTQKEPGRNPTNDVLPQKWGNQITFGVITVVIAVLFYCLVLRRKD